MTSQFPVLEKEKVKGRRCADFVAERCANLTPKACPAFLTQKEKVNLICGGDSKADFRGFSCSVG